MKRGMIAVLMFACVLWTGVCQGAEPAAAKKADARPGKRPAVAAAAASDAVNLRVDVSAKYLSLEGTARFLVGNGTQSNFITGGDQAHLIKNSQGEGVEFKKTGFLVNVLPVLNPDNDRAVSVQIQVELSGPTPGIKVGENEVPHVSTWQWQSSVSLVRGKKTVLVEAPARFEMTVDYAPTE